jgi:hypothetical protein
MCEEVIVWAWAKKKYHYSFTAHWSVLTIKINREVTLSIGD